jgi:chemotaxis protein CheD
MIEIFLQPGDLFVADADYRLRTLLGSCVSITLWHPASKTGGMTHSLLPTRGIAAPKHVLDGRYGDESLQIILNQFKQAGVPISQCEVKVFGGGNMFPDHVTSQSINVGQRNGLAAKALLLKNGITIMSEYLFGIGHRQVIFDVSNGNVWSRQVKPIDK